MVFKKACLRGVRIGVVPGGARLEPRRENVGGFDLGGEVAGVRYDSFEVNAVGERVCRLHLASGAVFLVGARAGELHTRICLAFYADLVLVAVLLRQQLCT